MAFPYYPAENQDPTSASFAGGRSPNDVRTRVDLATAMYTDLDTGQVRTWWEQRMYLEQRNRAYAWQLAGMRYVGSDMQALFGRKPFFVDDWFGGYVPSYRQPNPRADLTQINAVYGLDAPQPYPPGPLPNYNGY